MDPWYSIALGAALGVVSVLLVAYIAVIVWLVYGLTPLLDQAIRRTNRLVERFCSWLEGE